MGRSGKHVISRIASAMLLAVMTAAPAVAVESGADRVYAELPNFHKVDDNVYRGGQPASGGVQRLKELGVRTIVNLRYERDLIDSEAAEAEAAGLRYVNVPMVGLNRPTEGQVARILALIDDPVNRPVFIHCKAGSDRTGAMVACYRIARARWTAERAIEECFRYGMMRVEYAKRAFIRSFYAKLSRTASGV